MAELVISGFIDDQLLRAGRRWPDIVDIHFVRLQFVLQKGVPLEDAVLVAVHEAGAGLYIEPRVMFLDGLKLACGVDDDVPASRLLTDRVVVFLQAVDAKGDRHVQVRKFVREEAMNASHIADGSNEDIQKDWRKRAAGRHPRIPLQNFFVMEIHAARSEQYSRFTGCWRPPLLLERSSLVWYAR